MNRFHLWPDASERLLLHAALDDGDSAVAAFARWSAQIDWSGDIEAGSFRLLPLVHANLSRLGASHPLMGRLAGVRRYHWCAAQLHLQRGADVLASLRLAGIEVMVTKGIALATSVYADPALRPMSDIDVLVSPAKAIDALEVLRTAGWAEAAAVESQWQNRRADMLILSIGNNLYHPSAGEVDLHWALMHEASGIELDRAVWADARPIMIKGEMARRPSSSFMLLHVIVHGLRPNALSPLRWVADAAMLLRREHDAIDWVLVHHWADRLAVGQRFAAGLAFLRDEMGLELPPDALPDSLTMPRWLERLENRSWQAQLARQAGTPRTGLERAAQLARLVASSHRSELPRLAFDWLGRRAKHGR